MEIAVDCYRSLVELVGLVIEKTEAAYLKSFPCVVVKKTFQITCGIASFQIQKIKLILSYLPPCAKLRVPSDLGLDWKLVNRLPKIQTEAEFSILMSEYFAGFPPSGGMRNYAHGGKGPFRTSY